MPETTPLIKAALNLRGGAGFDVYLPELSSQFSKLKKDVDNLNAKLQNDEIGIEEYKKSFRLYEVE